MPSRRATRSFAASLLVTAAGVAVGLLWAARRQPASDPVEAKQQKPALVRIVPPHDSFDDGPELTALPQVAPSRLAGADDYESIGIDELSSAFLSRATESWSELDDSEVGADAELDGFQIATIEDLTVPELSDDPADFEIPARRRARS